MLRFQVLRDRWPHTLYGLRVASLPAVDPPTLQISAKDAERRSPKAAPRPACAWRSPPIWGRQSGRAARLCGRTPIDPELALQWGVRSGARFAPRCLSDRHAALRYVAGLPGERHRSLWEARLPEAVVCALR